MGKDLKGAEITVKSWFDYWISMKKRTVRPNTVRNYTERYERNIDPIIGKLLLSEVRLCRQYSDTLI